MGGGDGEDLDTDSRGVLGSVGSDLDLALLPKKAMLLLLLLIVDGGGLGGVRTIGSSKVKELPLPSPSEYTLISPSCRLMIPPEIQSPSPLPPPDWSFSGLNCTISLNSLV